MNEVPVVIVHNSKSKRDNLNVYIYCCDYHVVSEKCHQKKKEDERSQRRPSQLLNMYYLEAICIDLNMSVLSWD